ncbi:MAG: glucosamine-6-phosphate deaminase [Nanoarchaeota archaeon]
MKIIYAKNYEELSKIATSIIIKEINKKLNIVIGFATGETPLGLYKELARSYKRKKVDFSKVKSFNLDEYYPITRDNKNSFYYYMFRNLFNKINIQKSNINLLNGETKNPSKECRDYEVKIKKNPISIQILGVGINGHIGFNEPGSDFNSKTRLINLTKETIKRNSKIHKIPAKALTMGIKTIMKARKIILLADGRDKSNAIYHLIKGKTNKNYPVSFLKKHKNLVVIVDKSVGINLK